MEVSIISDKVLVNRSATRLYGFLRDFRNFEKLMPEQVTKWNATETSCSFTIKNMGHVSLKIIELKENAHVKITGDGKTPFEFDLIARLDPISDESTNVHMQIIANMSPMIQMMAKKPLQNLVNHMAHKVREHHSDQEEK